MFRQRSLVAKQKRAVDLLDMKLDIAKAELRPKAHLTMSSKILSVQIELNDRLEREVKGRDHIGSASCGSASSASCSADSETPRSRTGLGTGISFCSNATARLSSSLRFEIATGTDLLRVMISKSLNFILSVTVRPRLPAPSQYRQTLSMSGSSSRTMASKSVRSVENVFSAPTDLRIRSARTSRLSTPREIQ